MVNNNSTSNNQRMARALQAIEKLQARVSELQQASTEPIAIIGLGCRFPGGGDSPAAFWQLLHEGRDAISEVPSDRWNADAYHHPEPATTGKIVTRYGGFVDHLQAFDANFFGIAPKEAVSLDPQQRLLLEVAWEAMEHAGAVPERWAGQPVGVFVGISSNDYSRHLLQRPETDIDAYLATGNSHSAAAGRLSYSLGLTGPSLAVDTACSSSLVAVHLACQSLRNRECDAALAGGVNRLLAPEFSINFSQARMLAPDGRCKTFDAAADGFARGEGGGVVVLKRLTDAVADGDTVLALIRGSAVNQDGRSGGLTVPNGPAQQAVIRQALAQADLQPKQIGYIEAHGTGTSLGDPIEVGALGAVFGSSHTSEQPLYIGSVKTNIGHLEAAAGIAGLIKVVLAMQHETLPPHLHFHQPSPHISWADLPIAVTAQAQSWNADQPRFAGISSFGFSGTNAHVILAAAVDQKAKNEERRAWPARSRTKNENRTWHLLTLAAKDSGALQELAQRYAEWLPNTTASLVDICWSGHQLRSHFSHRLAIAVSSRQDAQSQLAAIADQPTPSFAHTPRKIAFLFTGQGSQYSHMGRELYSTEFVFRQAIDQCAEILTTAGIDLLEVLYGENAQPITQNEAPITDNQEPKAPPISPSLHLPIHSTAYTQPALFALEYALAQLWLSWGIEPAGVMGHSIGEYVAACVAGVFSLEDGLQLVTARGRLMQALPAGGGMVAVMAAADHLSGMLSEGVAIAAINGPAATVISGELTALESVVARLTEQGIKTKSLTVSHAFHSALMEPMLTEFRAAANQVNYALPQTELVSNVTGQIATAEVATADYWVRHVRQPVQFAAGMQTLAAQGYNTFVEIGAKPVLLAMGRTCLPDFEALWLPSLRPAADWQTLLISLGKLYVAGASINWTALDQVEPDQRVSLPTYPFQRQRYWVDIDRSQSNILPPASPPTPLSHAPTPHPLLGTLLNLPRTNTRHFESHISANMPAYLADHQVFGAVVLPAAGFIEMAIAALRSIQPHQSLALKAVTIHQALVLNQPQTVQVLLLPKEDQLYQFEILSLTDTEWVLHASGQVMEEALENPADLAQLQSRCGDSVAVDACYQRLAAQGVTYGARFRAIKKLWQGNSEVLSQLRLPEALHSTAAVYQLHPVLLDACLQSLAAVFLNQSGSDTYLPAGVAEVHIRPGIDWAQADYQLWCYAQVQPGDRDITANLQLFLNDGRLVGTLIGLKLRPAASERVLGTPQFQNWLYQIDWQAQSLPQAAATAEFLLSPAAICHQVAPSFEDLVSQSGILDYQQRLLELDALSLEYVERAISTFGELPPSNEPIELAQIWGIKAQHEALFQHLLGRLTEKRGSQEAEEKQGNPSSPHLPILQPELTLLTRCGENLVAVLRGEIDPLTLLFPDGDLSDLTRLYESSIGAQVMNSLVQRVVTAATARSPRPLRILEIGAGTGGTTTHLLPQLPDSEYVFTDVSPLFLAKARERFQDYDGVRYELLDIERSPAAQGFQQPFDLVIAANVLHATADLRQTLTHVHELLAPGGELMLLESTQPLLWLDMIFGLTEGWWKFTDRDLRPDHPLLSAAQWQTLLAESGFTPAILQSAAEADQLDPVPPHLDLPQTVIVAQRDQLSTQPGQTATCLVLAASQDEAEAVIATLEKPGRRGIGVAWGDRYSQLASDRFILNPLQTENFQQLWQALTTTHALPTQVIYLASSGEKLNPPALERSCSGLLHLVQTLAEVSQPPALCLVTQGVARPPVVNPAQAPLWGLGRVIALEHPALRCCRLDLDPQSSPQQQRLDLSRELDNEPTAATVAYRQAQRSVARLEPVSLSPSLELPHQSSQEMAFRLAIAAKGTPDALQIQPCHRRFPGPEEVEIRVDAAGLNFIDVLDTLGLLPFERDWLGVECAGTVVTVGDRVTHLQVGDRVMALAAGSFAQYVTVPAILAAPPPLGLSAVAAATIPANFLTAYYALVEVAQVQPGERVLIHAAAGGTGMAAVQIALSRGAEVFATASPAKWEILKRMGVRQVMNSRTLDFAEETLAATDGAGVDIIFNSLSSEFIPQSLAVLKSQGRFIEIGKRDVWSAEQVVAVQPQVTYHLVDLLSLTQQVPQQIQAMLQALVPLFATEQLQPLPHRVFPLSSAISAFRTMQQAKHVGKIVLQVSGNREQGIGNREQEEPRTQNLGLRPESFLPLPHSSTPPLPTYLLTGGLGGLGLLTADWLAAQGACHLVLISRRSLADHPPETHTQIQALEAKGAKVTVIQTDVAQRDQLAATIAAIDSPIHGVIHAAGVLDDGVLQQLTWERLESVLAPKAYGAWHLHELTQEQPLAFFVLFSSAASLLGSPGQGSHVAANAFLDALAHHRQTLGLPSLSINWGAWSGVGAAAQRQVDQQMQARGVEAITPDQGIQIFSQLLAQPSEAQVGVVPIRWAQLLSQGWSDAFFERFQPSTPVVQPTADWRNRLENLPPQQRLSFLTTALQQEVAQVLGRAASQLPDPQLGFFDLGLDSLMAVELKNRLEGQLGTTVSSTAIFEHPTIAALAQHLAAVVLPEPLLPPSRGEPELPRRSELASGKTRRPVSASDSSPPPATSVKPEPSGATAAPPDLVAEELTALERLLNQYQSS